MLSNKIRLSRLSTILFIGLICLGCGKRRPPQPPTERIPQRAEISGYQFGNQIKLQWTLAPRNASDQSILSIRRADVYRLAEAITSPLSLTEEDFASRSTLIGSVQIPAISPAQTRLVNYTDKLDFAGQTVRLRYAVRYINANGQPAAFSNFLLITPISRVANPPRLVDLQSTETAVKLNWEIPTANADGSTPPNIIGYNVYRSSDGSSPAMPKLLNQSPVTDKNFADESFKFGEKYMYFVRTVSFGEEAVPVESFDSNSLSVLPKDIFPPKPPEGLTIAAAPNRLSLFFVANAEKDLAGYNVFRSTDPDLPKEQWAKLTKEVISATTFQDENTESGRKYFYFVTAIDQNGNSSSPSEIVSEVAP